MSPCRWAARPAQAATGSGSSGLVLPSTADKITLSIVLLKILQQYSEPMQIWTASTGRMTSQRVKAGPLSVTKKVERSRRSASYVRRSTLLLTYQSTRCLKEPAFHSSSACCAGSGRLQQWEGFEGRERKRKQEMYCNQAARRNECSGQRRKREGQGVRRRVGPGARVQ